MFSNDHTKTKEAEVKLVGNDLIYSGKINNEGATLFQEKAYTFLKQFRKCMEINNGNSSEILTNSKKGKKEDKCKIDINRPLSIHITSGGGRVAQGIAMMNTIEELNREIPTRCVSKGFVGSAATYSAFACKERLAGANTQFLLHPPSKYGVSGQTDDLIVTAENSKRTFQTILDIYYRKSRVEDSTDAINATFKDNEYSSAKEIKALGLIDEILE